MDPRRTEGRLNSRSRLYTSPCRGAGTSNSQHVPVTTTCWLRTAKQSHDVIPQLRLPPLSYLCIVASLCFSRPMDTIGSPNMAAPPRFKLVFFAPSSAVAACQAAVFAAGAGRVPGRGNYSECAFVSRGTGQFRPGDEARPHVGTLGKLEQVEEVRCETICVGSDTARAAVDALKR